MKIFRPKVDGDDGDGEDDDAEEDVGRTGPDGVASLFSPSGAAWVATPLPWSSIPIAMVTQL